jgi:phage host-nuclease inhibitor protein Gam
LRGAVRRTLGAGAVSATKLTARHGAPGDLFGNSVAISGQTAVVGAPGVNSHTGAAYVFVHTKKGWSRQAQLAEPHAAKGDHFGFSVAISGETAVVGAYARNSNTGAAYAFVRTKKGWSLQAKLTDRRGTKGDSFGVSVAISGSTAVVGA